MEKVDLIVLSKWLVPMTNEVEYLEDHSIVVKGEKILDILPNSKVLEKYSSDQILKLDKEHVLMPGLINTHTHSSMSLIRSYVDNVTLMDWLQSFIWPTEGKFVSSEFVYDGTELAISEMIKTGTTCFHDMYFFPEATAQAVDKTGIRACIGNPILKFPTNYAKDEDDYLLKGEELVNKYKNHGRIILAISPHAPYTVSDLGYKKVVEFSKKHNVLIHTHLHETEFEVLNEKRENGGEHVRPIVRLNELGVLGSNFIAAHMVHANDEDIQILSNTKSSIVHCPQSNMKLASGVAPIKKFLDNGVNVCLGTDNVDNVDLFNDIKISGLLAKIKENSGKALSAKTILSMATINGAKALGVDDKIGTLEKGKFADFISVRMDSKPVYNPINSLVYVGLGVNKVTHSWVSGQLLLNDGVLTTINEKDLDLRTSEWRKKIIISQQENQNKN